LDNPNKTAVLNVVWRESAFSRQGSSAKKRFKRGFKRYLRKNYTYGKNTFGKRVEYRKEVWKKAPSFYIVLVLGFVCILILLDIFNVEIHPLLFLLMFIILVLLYLLEFWYVGSRE
jgi:hypothetical protein